METLLAPTVPGIIMQIAICAFVLFMVAGLYYEAKEGNFWVLAVIVAGITCVSYAADPTGAVATSMGGAFAVAVVIGTSYAFHLLCFGILGCIVWNMVFPTKAK